MRKLLLVLVILVGLFIPSVVYAGTTDTITITATGSEVDISINPAFWDAGTVYTSGSAQTAINAATLTNNGSDAVDVTVGGRSMKDTVDGLQKTWTLANTGTPGASIIGVYVGLDDADDLFDIVVKNVGETLNQLVNELASSGTQDFGIKLFAPTSSIGNYEMEMVGSTGSTADADRGLLFTGSID